MGNTPGNSVEVLQSLGSLADHNVSDRLDLEVQISELRVSISGLLEEEGFDSVEECVSALGGRQLELERLEQKGKGGSKPANTLRVVLDSMTEIVEMDKV
jgi:hypothetical protein